MKKQRVVLGMGRDALVVVLVEDDSCFSAGTSMDVRNALLNGCDKEIDRCTMQESGQNLC